MNTATKERIIELFEKHRKLPGTFYQEERFLDYLLSNPKKRDGFTNSFSGLRRYNAFIDEVQMEFLICFANKDRERHYSLNDFVKRVNDLEKSPRSSLAALRSQMKQRVGWNFVIFANIVVIIVSGAILNIFGRDIIVFLSVSILLLFLVNFFIFQIYRKARCYEKKLMEQIKKHNDFIEKRS